MPVKTINKQAIIINPIEILESNDLTKYEATVKIDDIIDKFLSTGKLKSMLILINNTIFIIKNKKG